MKVFGYSQKTGLNEYGLVELGAVTLSMNSEELRHLIVALHEIESMFDKSDQGEIKKDEYYHINEMVKSWSKNSPEIIVHKNIQPPNTK